MIVRCSNRRRKRVEPRIASSAPLLVYRIMAEKQMPEQPTSTPATEHEHPYADDAAEKNRKSGLGRSLLIIAAPQS